MIKSRRTGRVEQHQPDFGRRPGAGPLEGDGFRVGRWTGSGLALVWPRIGPWKGMASGLFAGLAAGRGRLQDWPLEGNGPGLAAGRGWLQDCSLDWPLDGDGFRIGRWKAMAQDWPLEGDGFRVGRWTGFRIGCWFGPGLAAGRQWPRIGRWKGIG